MLKNLKSKFLALSRAGKIAVVAVALIGVSTIASMGNNSTIETTATKPQSPLDKPETKEIIQEAVTTKETATEMVDVPFEKLTVDDSNLASGATETRTAGVVGKKTLTYELTKVNGVQTDKKLLKEEVTTQPINEVTAKGTKVAAAPKPTSSCSPHYSGCVPIASDVDCAGGSGNGPAYAYGPISVIGVDIYDLDRDGNGIACE